MNAPSKPHLIYLVTQNPQLSAEMISQLELFNFSVRSFSRQSALLAAIHSDMPFALVVDESGLVDAALTQFAPLIGRLTKSPVMYLSEPLSVVEQLEMMRLGMSEFVSKPLNIQQLIDRLDHMIEQSQASPINVLIVDDSESVSRWTTTSLRAAGMQVQALSNPLDVFLSLERFKPDIILMDVYMPQCGGDEIARVIRQNPQYDSLPIVFLSTETRRGRQLMARAMGGDDFLVKGIEAEELVAVVTMTAERYRKLRRWMTRDSLTGLLNHTNLTDELDRNVQRAVRENRQLSFAMIDIDHFKHVNDTYGHMVGDQVIKSLARMMTQAIGDAYAVGRYGGEEFAVIYDDLSLIRAAQKLDEMRLRFASLELRGGGGLFHATFSAGVAKLEPGMSASQLIDIADEALYRAKQAGRNQIAVGLGQLGVGMCPS